ncbi:hypothetical protein HJC23_000195 [Cyclotella cryptica]|uniref:Uncharacterized protein n=1 Tax=Cyclotella cryptica TaxID=29204 RepID=A0ABD3QEN2_9STRA|eukprot:CCRYP_006379-RA/>CCRYP_006379-RA protein AED:0.35 eAED:0.35 QI:0/-1/0/1/-1/1/1/0/160
MVKQDGEKSNPIGKQHLETWLLDRFFFNQPNKTSKSVVEHVCYLKEHSSDKVSAKTQYRYGLEVLASRSSSTSDASTLLCEDVRLIENMVVTETKGNTPFHCAATWALTCLSLDAFCLKLTKLKTLFEGQSDDEKLGSDQRLLLNGNLSCISHKNSKDDD